MRPFSKKAAVLDPNVRQYLETALWSSTDMETEEPLDKNHTVEDIPADFVEKAKADWSSFVQKAGPLLNGLDLSQVAHDFWLTRNRHGAGFWESDRGYSKEVGKALTDLAHSFGEEYLDFYEPSAEEAVENLPTMDVEKAKDDLLTQLSIETDPEKKKSLERRYKHLTMASLKKQADLKEYSNKATKGINDFIVQHPKVMEVVIDAAQRATDEKSFTDWLQEALTGEGMEEGVRKEVKWEELGWAWFNTVNRETTEPTPTDLINKLPTLDKPKKIDELLEQLSIEKDPAKKEQIKQHIERIKRGSLKQADELGEPMSPIQPAIDRGQQEISKYSPEYEFLVRLVKLITREGVPAQEIKSLAESQPFVTIDDIGDLTAKIWTLATTKYNIPREWLISKLPEKKIKADLWPSQEAASEGTCTQAPGQIATNPNQEKDTSVSGPNPQDVANEDALWDIVVNEFLTAHKRWSEVVKAIRLAHPEVTESVILSLKDRVKKSLDNQMGMIGSLNKKASMGKFWIYPDGDYEQINEDSEHQDWLQEVEGLDAFQAFDKGWVRASVDKDLGSYQLKDFSNIPKSLDDFIISHPSKEIEIADRNGYNYIKISYEDAISKGIQRAINRKLVTAKRHLNMDQVIKILDSKEPKIEHVDMHNYVIELTDGTKLSFDEATKRAMEISKTSSKLQCPKCKSLNLEAYDEK